MGGGVLMGMYEEGRNEFLASIAGLGNAEILDETARYMRAMLCHLDGRAALGAMDLAGACDEAMGEINAEVEEFDDDEHIRRDDEGAIAQAAMRLLDDPKERNELIGRLKTYIEDDGTALHELLVPLIQSALDEALNLEPARALLGRADDGALTEEEA